jgi:hypothetical protein
VLDDCHKSLEVLAIRSVERHLAIGFLECILLAAVGEEMVSPGFVDWAPCRFSFVAADCLCSGLPRDGSLEHPIGVVCFDAPLDCVEVLNLLRSVSICASSAMIIRGNCPVASRCI